MGEVKIDMNSSNEWKRLVAISDRALREVAAHCVAIVEKHAPRVLAGGASSPAALATCRAAAALADLLALIAGAKFAELLAEQVCSFMYRYISRESC